MSPEVSDLLKRALALSADERAALANTLLDSLETGDESVQEAWDKEVARRMEELKAGKAVTVPWEQLHRELLAIVNERQPRQYFAPLIHCGFSPRLRASAVKRFFNKAQMGTTVLIRADQCYQWNQR